MRKITRFAAISLALSAFFALTACGGKQAAVLDERPLDISYTDIQLGSTGTDIATTITLLSHRTDMLATDYPGKGWSAYLAEFNKLYPDIRVQIEGITDYASTAVMRLQGGDWGDIMMIPAIDKKDLSSYFLPFGSESELCAQVRFADQWAYGGQVYGIPSTGNAQGVLYNKKVFREAGITKLPATPDEFLSALRLIRMRTKAVPLYTNYAAGWTLGAWDAYIGGSATGDADFMNKTLVHSKAPFANRDDGTGPYAVYKILYDAVAERLIEDDYSTTDWESCKGKLNRGEIATMMLGSWAFTQMQGAGPNADDIGYMPFPITVNGKQYASAGPDYNFGINLRSSNKNKEAALIFIKWMTERSGFAFNEGGIPLAVSDTDYPPVYAAFDGIDFVADNPAVPGEEDFKAKLDADSELNINNGGDDKIQRIVEHADKHDRSFDEIMAGWNQAWAKAQERNGIQAD